MGDMQEDRAKSEYQQFIIIYFVFCENQRSDNTDQSSNDFFTFTSKTESAASDRCLANFWLTYFRHLFNQTILKIQIIFKTFVLDAHKKINYI